MTRGHSPHCLPPGEPLDDRLTSRVAINLHDRSEFRSQSFEGPLKDLLLKSRNIEPRQAFGHATWIAWDKSLQPPYRVDCGAQFEGRM